MKKKLFLIAAILALVVLAALIVSTPRLEPDPPLPNPNGYDDFLRAATQLEANPLDWQAMDGEKQYAALKKLVATNQAALDLARIGLTKECRVAPYEMNATNGTHLNDLAGSKALAQAFQAASTLALIEGRTNDAASLAVDCIRYGNESVRGGVIIDHLVGIAIKAIGLSSLKSAAGGMDWECAHQALSGLETVQARAETAGEVFERERQWARRGRFGPAPVPLQIMQPFLNRKLQDRVRQSLIKIEADLLRMRIQLAARAYELEQGKPPASASELVPTYLKAVPKDPTTGKEMPLD